MTTDTEGDSRTVIINSNAWSLSLPGLTASGEPCEDTTIGCNYASYHGKAVNHSLLHSLYGRPDLFKIKYNSAKGFLYHETAFLECNWGSAGAHGSTSNDAEFRVVFSLSRPGRVRIVGATGYAVALQGGPIMQRKQGSHTSDVIIFDITDPLNPVLVYSWSGTQLDPGGIFEIDDTVHLASGRIYALDFVSWSTEVVEASSETVGPPSVVSAYASGGGGAGAVIAVFYEKDAGSGGAPSEVIRSDINGDRCVDDADLMAVLFCLGELVDVGENDVIINSDCLAADVNMDGVVDDTDLLIVLFNFGICY